MHGFVFAFVSILRFQQINSVVYDSNKGNSSHDDDDQ